MVFLKVHLKNKVCSRACFESFYVLMLQLKKTFQARLQSRVFIKIVKSKMKRPSLLKGLILYPVQKQGGCEVVSDGGMTWLREESGSSTNAGSIISPL